MNVTSSISNFVYNAGGMLKPGGGQGLVGVLGKLKVPLPGA